MWYFLVMTYLLRSNDHIALLVKKKKKKKKK